MRYTNCYHSLPGELSAKMPVSGTFSPNQAISLLVNASQSFFSFSKNGLEVVDLQIVSASKISEINNVYFNNKLIVNYLPIKEQPASMLAMHNRKPQSGKHDSNEMMKTQFLPLSPPYS